MQKFFRGQRVRHVRGQEAIIDHSYSDSFGRYDGGRSDSMLSTLWLDKDGKPDARTAWHMDKEFELVSDDRHAGERLLQTYKDRDSSADNTSVNP